MPSSYLPRLVSEWCRNLISGISGSLCGDLNGNSKIFPTTLLIVFFLFSALNCYNYRSGNMEGSVAVTVMAAPAVVGSDISSSGRTWKMIKGKVSQTIEDIKSAKTANSSNNSNTAAGTGLNNANNNNSTPLSNVILKGNIKDNFKTNLFC